MALQDLNFENQPTPSPRYANSILSFRLMPLYKQKEVIHKYLRIYIQQQYIHKWTKEDTLNFIIYLIKCLDYENP